MKYKSINEIDKFSFEDCIIRKFEVRDDNICLELEALRVMPDNSQNINYTESYSGTTEVRLLAGKIISGVKDGYKYYNANDELIKETSDEPLGEKEILELTKNCEGAYLYSLNRKDETDGLYHYSMGIEFADEDNTMSDSYQLELAFEKAIFEWDFYMNRVQKY